MAHDSKRPRGRTAGHRNPSASRDDAKRGQQPGGGGRPSNGGEPTSPEAISSWPGMADMRELLQQWPNTPALVIGPFVDQMLQAGMTLARLQGSAWLQAMQWMGGGPAPGSATEVAEATVEHVAHPIAASPLIWPSQEAYRQMLNAGMAAWSDWLGWSQRMTQSVTPPRG